jgi:hypothetical protein
VAALVAAVAVMMQAAHIQVDLVQADKAILVPMVYHLMLVLAEAAVLAVLVELLEVVMVALAVVVLHGLTDQLTQAAVAVLPTDLVVVADLVAAALVLVVIQHQLLLLEHQILEAVAADAAVLKLETILEPEVRVL